MQIRLFTISINDQGESLQEMNRFLAIHKVLEIEQQFYENKNSAYWCFCIRYILVSNFNATQQANKVKVDYKQLLNEKEFMVFSHLRECRKTIAQNDAVPAYAVFTDEELAGIARLSDITASQLITIKGIGQKKVEKYGSALIELFNNKNVENETTS